MTTYYCVFTVDTDLLKPPAEYKKTSDGLRIGPETAEMEKYDELGFIDVKEWGLTPEEAKERVK